jgi:hypothetical protein
MPPRGHKQSAATKAKISASLRAHYRGRGVHFVKPARPRSAARHVPAAGRFGSAGTIRLVAYGKPAKPILTRGRTTGFLPKSGGVTRVGVGYNFKRR